MPKRYVSRKKRTIRRPKRRFVRRRYGMSRRSNIRLASHFWQFKRSAIMDDGDTSSVTLYAIDATAQLVSTTAGVWNAGVIGAAAPVAGTPYYTGMTIHPALEDLPNYTEFTSLYDQYKIKGVAVKLTPLSTFSGASSGSAIPYGQMNAFVHSSIDYDGGALPTASGLGTIQYLKQYSNYKMKRLVGSKPLKYYFTPKTRMDAEGTQNAVLSSKYQWTDCSHANFGARQLNLLFEIIPCASNLDLNLVFRVDVTYYLCFKGQR